MTALLKLQRIIGSILLVGLGTLLPMTSATAHTDLVNTSPVADSDVLASEPVISLTFAEPVLVDGAAIVVLNSAGDTLDTPTPTLEGATISIPWPVDLTPGQVTVQWRATGQDGHVLTGEYGFNYTAAAEGGMAPSPTDSAMPTEPEASATPEAVAMSLGAEDSAAEGSNNLVIGIAIVSLVGLVAAGMFLRRSK
jgi:methionine-rich copper-binding protein CopC